MQPVIQGSLNLLNFKSFLLKDNDIDHYKNPVLFYNPFHCINELENSLLECYGFARFLELDSLTVEKLIINKNINLVSADIQLENLKIEFCSDTIHAL